MRVAALIACVLLLCGMAAGCRQNPSSLSSNTLPSGTVSAVDPTDTLALSFNPEDTLNPYTAKTQLNLYLSHLLYDTLVKIDAGFMPIPSLAKSAELTDSTHLTVSITSGAVFSDGSSITPQDVVYSFEKAKGSVNYRAFVSNFQSAAVKKGTVVFTLSSPDPYAAACLIFPIVKRGTDTDKPAAAPIGSGPYLYNPDTLSLSVNPKAKAENARFTTVSLKAMVSQAEMLQAFESGNIHYFYDDLSDGSIPRTTASQTTVDQNQLVYLGVNTQKPLLSSPEFRRAVSLALDRTAIASSAYTGRARPAVTPFHPLWKPAAGVISFPASPDSDTAKTLLKTALDQPATVPTTDTTDTTDATAPTATPTTAQAAKSATVPVLTLLYPSGNSCREAAAKLIVRQLALTGIPVTATPVSYNDYLIRLSAGDYDLYLGEIRLAPNMNLQVFFGAGNAASYGVPTGGNAAVQYAALRRGETSLSDFARAFSEEMPYIPLVFKQGMAAYHRSISYITPSSYNVFDGILKWQ